MFRREASARGRIPGTVRSGREPRRDQREDCKRDECDSVLDVMLGRVGGVTREERGQVVRLMLGDGLRPALYGLALGLAASAGAVRLIQSMLYGTRPLDPAIFAAVAATLLVVAALACLVPAWRASRIDPMQALRTE